MSFGEPGVWGDPGGLWPSSMMEAAKAPVDFVVKEAPRRKRPGLGSGAGTSQYTDHSEQSTGEEQRGAEAGRSRPSTPKESDVSSNPREGGDAAHGRGGFSAALEVEFPEFGIALCLRLRRHPDARRPQRCCPAVQALHGKEGLEVIKATQTLDSF